MFFSKKSALLLLPILCLVTNGQEYDPCLMYTSYGDCSMCILGKIPFGKQCLDAIPHCLQYSREFKCTNCEVGYSVSGDGNCSAKAVSYYEMKNEEIRMDQYFIRIEPTLAKIASKYPGNTDLLKLYKKLDPQINYYRAVYRNPTSVYQIITRISRIDNRITVEGILEIVPFPFENIINQNQDPLLPFIKQKIQFLYPTLNIQSILIIYASQNGNTYTYRLVILDIEKGVQQLVFTILPKFNANEIDPQPLSLLEIDDKYKKNLQLFKNRYQNIFRNGSADKIGKTIRNSQNYYFIFMRGNGKIYQIQYNLGRDEEVDKYEISIINEQFYAQIPVFAQKQVPKMPQFNFQNIENNGFSSAGTSVLPSKSPQKNPFQVAEVTQKETLDRVIKQGFQYVNNLDLVGFENPNSNHYIFIYGSSNDFGEIQQKWKYNVNILADNKTVIQETSVVPTAKDSERYLTAEEYLENVQVSRVIREIANKNGLQLFVDTKIQTVKETIKNGQTSYQVVLIKNKFIQLTYMAKLDLSNGNVTIISSKQKVLEIVPPYSFTQEQMFLYPPVINMRQLLAQIYPDFTTKGLLSKVDLQKGKNQQNIYTFTYVHVDGRYIFKLTSLPNGGFNILSTQKVGVKGKTQPFEIIIASLGGNKLSAQDIESDKYFQIVNQFIRKEYLFNLNTKISSQSMVDVYRIKKSSNHYYQIFYPYKDGTGGWLYNVAISTIDTTVLQIQKAQFFSNFNKKLTTPEISDDEKLSQIDKLFKVIYLNRLGFNNQATIIDVGKKVENGRIYYQITYLLQDQKSTLTYSVLVIFNGKIQVVGISQGIRQDLYDSEPKLINPNDYDNDIYFVEVQNYLQDIEKALKKDQIREVLRQRTPLGNQYWLTYRNQFGDGYKFNVFRSVQGRLQVKSINQIGNAPEQIPTIPQKQLNVKQALANINFQKVDQYIRKFINLQGFVVDKVFVEQKKNGYAYRTVYKNQNNLNIYAIEAFLSLEGKIEITSSQLTKAQPTLTTQKIDQTTPPPQIDVVYLTAQQLRNDSSLLRIDTFLRSSNLFLTGYSIYSVGVLRSLNNSTQIYTLIYQNGQNLAIMFKVSISNPGDVLKVIETQRLQLTTSLNQKNLPYPITFLKTKENETYLPFNSFQISQPQLAYYFLYILSTFSIQASDIQYILFSSSADTYKLITTNNIVYVMEKNKYDGTYWLKQIQDIGHKIPKQQNISIKTEDFNRIISKMGLGLSVQMVDRISGRYYVAYQGYVKYYHLTVALKDGRKYKVVLMQASAESNDYKLISMSLENNISDRWNFDDQVFQEFGNINQLLMQISQIKIPNWNNILNYSLKLQRDRGNSNIYRATFETVPPPQPQNDLNSLSYRVQVIYEKDGNGLKLLSYNLMDGGLSQLREYKNLNLYLGNQNKNIKVEPGFSELVDVDRLLRQQWGTRYLQTSQISFGMGQKIGSFYIFYLVYRNANESLAFTILKISKSKILITAYNQLYSSSESPRYIYGTLENVEPVKITQARKSRAFQIAQKKLFDGYSHYLLGSVIRQILIDDSSSPNIINYNIVYQTGNGVFLAVLDYLKDTNEGRIRALVLIGAAGLQKKAADCQAVNGQNPGQCLRCDEGFFVEKNRLCYQNVENCGVQAGSNCIDCENPYYLRDNRCISNCREMECIY